MQNSVGTEQPSNLCFSSVGRAPRERSPVALPLHELPNRFRDALGHLGDQDSHRQISEPERQQSGRGGNDEDDHYGHLLIFRSSKFQTALSRFCPQSSVSETMSSR